MTKSMKVWALVNKKGEVLKAAGSKLFLMFPTKKAACLYRDYCTVSSKKEIVAKKGWCFADD